MDEKIPSYFLQVALRSIETEAEGQELFVLQASIAVTKAYWNQYNGETKEGELCYDSYKHLQPGEEFNAIL